MPSKWPMGGQSRSQGKSGLRDAYSFQCGMQILKIVMARFLEILDGNTFLTIFYTILTRKVD